jgi:hypothetical protein
MRQSRLKVLKNKAAYKKCSKTKPLIKSAQKQHSFIMHFLSGIKN